MKSRKLLYLPLKVAAVFIALVLLYFISALVLSKIEVNSDFKEDEQNEYEIYLLTNGVHVDLVLPYKNEFHDWSKFVNAGDTKSGDTLAQFVAFGWGDKGFYLQTKTWGDLKFKTAFNALFYRSTSAMHVSFYKRMRVSESCKKIQITRESYDKLVKYIRESFDVDGDGNSLKIKDVAYHNYDSFYEAQGKYSLFFTCNTWTNDGLKAAGLKACLWTPFGTGILKLYDQ
jgi:uncharacterized protein (TIGR02117 family)